MKLYLVEPPNEVIGEDGRDWEGHIVAETPERACELLLRAFVDDEDLVAPIKLKQVPPPEQLGDCWMVREFPGFDMMLTHEHFVPWTKFTVTYFEQLPQ